jgi:hypothetical protein
MQLYQKVYINILLIFISIDDIKQYLSNKLFEQLKMEKLSLKDLLTMKNNLCTHILQSIYGTKQGAHNWYQHFRQSATTIFGYTASEVDPCLFFKNLNNNQKAYIGLYTDDILHCYPKNCNNERNRFLTVLQKMHTVSIKGIPEWFIGIKIERNRSENKIFLSQEQKIDQLLIDTDLLECKKCATPMMENIKFEMEPEFETKADKRTYQAIIGSLIYLATCTRPDIAFSVAKLVQYMSNPYESHFNGIKHILRYLKGTKQLHLHIGDKNKKFRN